jgi:deoxycytidine triphosphate deaminase
LTFGDNFLLNLDGLSALVKAGIITNAGSIDADFAHGDLTITATVDNEGEISVGNAATLSIMSCP